MTDFWHKVLKTPKCWQWLGKPNQRGFGRFRVDGKHVLAQVYSWELANDKLPDNLFLRNTCKNLLCVNPDHWVLTSRSSKGEYKKPPRRKLTLGERVMATPGARTEIAQLFGLTPSQVADLFS